MVLCTMCDKRNAIFMRPYSGERLCRKCFCKSIEDKVRNTISRYEMLEQDDKTMVAVSGGKDSIALLYILKKIERIYPNARICAVTIDEGITGYRDEALKLATKHCSELKVKHFVISFKELFGYTLDEIADLIQGNGLTPCSYCGVLRRRALNTIARETGVDKLATAHNLDDEAQTMILNIFHGDVSRISRVKPALNMINPRLVPRVKPLCQVPEREVTLYTYLNNLEFQSNPCPYAGTALRNDVRNMLNRLEVKHPGIKFTIFSSMERIMSTINAFSNNEKMQDCNLCGEPTSGKICKPCQMIRELSVIPT